MLRSRKVLSASCLFPSMAIVVLKDFMKVSKLLGVKRIVSISIKIPSPSSMKPTHFLIFIASQMRIYQCLMVISLDFKWAFFGFVFDVNIKKKGINFSSQQVENSFTVVKKNKIKAYLEWAEIGK